MGHKCRGRLKTTGRGPTEAERRNADPAAMLVLGIIKELEVMLGRSPHECEVYAEFVKRLNQGVLQ